MSFLNPKLNILPLAQQNIWQLLSEIPDNFVLYGGTAIALRLGHRESVDFDFFTHDKFSPKVLLNAIPFLQKGYIEQSCSSTLTIKLREKQTGDSVKFSFFGVELQEIHSPSIIRENNIKVASIVDLFGMKCATIYQRAEAKDYIDIDAIIKSGKDINIGISAARAIYGKQYSPATTQLALRYTKDVQGLNPAIEERLRRVSHEIDINKLSKLNVLRPIGSKKNQKNRNGLER